MFAGRDAYAHFSRAKALLPEDALERFELLEKHERLAYDLGEREQEKLDLDEMTKLAQRAAQEARVGMRRYAFLSVTGHPEEAYLAAQEAHRLYSELQDRGGQCEALIYLAQADYYKERFALAQAPLPRLGKGSVNAVVSILTTLRHPQATPGICCFHNRFNSLHHWL